ncbi:MAG: hypothetical protein JST89_00575 [Cyanobacteria bacterium SZAS-4]|nr:hypothetical protein [Cyanobacteria bacterium SZAS-4]
MPSSRDPVPTEQVLAIKPPLDDTSEKQKISDKDQKADFNFSQIMEKGASNLLPSKSDAMQATQNLVDKKILTNLTIVKEKDSNQGNPLRNKVKKKKRLMQELAKFDDELLAMLPADKLSSLLENKMEQGDSEAIATSLRVELKQMIADEMANGSTQKEIAKTSLPANSTPGSTSNSPSSSNSNANSSSYTPNSYSQNQQPPAAGSR